MKVGGSLKKKEIFFGRWQMMIYAWRWRDLHRGCGMWCKMYWGLEDWRIGGGGSGGGGVVEVFFLALACRWRRRPSSPVPAKKAKQLDLAAHPTRTLQTVHVLLVARLLGQSWPHLGWANIRIPPASNQKTVRRFLPGGIPCLAVFGQVAEWRGRLKVKVKAAVVVVVVVVRVIDGDGSQNEGKEKGKGRRGKG